jgi:hypothetical protein
MLGLLGTALVTGVSPATANNGGCCGYLDNGVAACTTTTAAGCRQLKGQIFKRHFVCVYPGGVPTCSPGESWFTCSDGKDCEAPRYCQGTSPCAGQCNTTGCQILDERSTSDLDHDGISDFLDNCAVTFNPSQTDTDGDGFGDACSPCQTTSSGDSTAPACNLVANRPGPPAQIDVQAQDTGSGLYGIDVLVSQNASVAVPGFDFPTTDPIVVTATKQDQSQGARVELRVVDAAGNCTYCDPVWTEMVRGTGKPVVETYTQLDGTEDTVTIENGAPGLRNLEIVVNGRNYRAAGLKDGEIRTLDVSAALLAGKQNIFTLKSNGKPGTSASVLIWDGESR